MGKQPDGSIVIRTLGDLLDNWMSISAYCARPTCGRELEIDVHRMVELFGRDTVYVAKRFPLKCAKCGGKDIGYIIGTDHRPKHIQERDGPPKEWQPKYPPLKGKRPDA